MKLSFLYKFIFIISFFLIPSSVFAQFEKGMKEYKGMRYKIYQIGKGKALTDSSIVQVHMRVFNSADSLLQQTYKEEIPALVNLRDSNNRNMPLVEILMKGTVGDSITIFTSSDSIYQGQNAMQRPEFIPPRSLIRQEFRIVKGYTMAEYLAVQEQIKAKQMKMQQEYMAEMQKQQMEMERQSDSTSKTQTNYIEDIYFVEKGITEYKKTESGLLYVVEKQGTPIKNGEKVTAHYKGTLLETGEKFDSSYDRQQPFEFTVGQGRVIKGWDEGIPLIGRGGKGTLYIPSNLAYGIKGAKPSIQPNEMLIFEVEVLDEYFDPNINQDYENDENEQEEEETTTQKKPNTYYIDDNQEDYIENVYLKLNDITDYKKTKSGLFYKIEKQGTTIKKGEKLKIRYEENFLITGEKLDSSHDSEKIHEITIGERNFIKGWEEGIPIIGKGGVGYLYIPSKLAYGKEEVGEQLEPNAMLIYKIEILED